MVISYVVPILCSDSPMLDKHSTYYLLVFRVSAILESVASEQTVLCLIDRKVNRHEHAWPAFVQFCKRVRLQRALIRNLLTCYNLTDIDQLVSV